MGRHWWAERLSIVLLVAMASGCSTFQPKTNPVDVTVFNDLGVRVTYGWCSLRTCEGTVTDQGTLEAGDTLFATVPDYPVRWLMVRTTAGTKCLALAKGDGSPGPGTPARIFFRTSAATARCGG